MIRIGVLSGKGGVGKSTVTVSLAYAFKDMGRAVGIIDADLTGPNINVAMGIEDELKIDAEKVKYLPIEKDNIRVLSMANILPQDAALMIKGYDSDSKAYTQTSIIKEFVNNTNWGVPLDVLLVDLPPGTADVTTAMLEYLKPDGAIIVTTPHSFAYSDYLRMMHMLEIYGIKVLKTIVNMAYLELPCEHPEVCKEETKSHTYEIFNDGDFKYDDSYEIPIMPTASIEHKIDLTEVAEEILQKFMVAK